MGYSEYSRGTRSTHGVSTEQTHGNAYIVVADGRSFVIVPSVHPVVAINDAKWDQCLKADLETLQVRSNPARGIGREGDRP